LNILVIEDRSAVRAVLHNMLGKMGHNMIDCESFERGFEYACKHRPDMIFIDLETQGLTALGTKAVGFLRATQAQWFPIITTSMGYKSEDYLKTIEAGADDCLFKPIDPLLLKAKFIAYLRIVHDL
jgi:two-component system, HptB-dependent secretion and biofilm response regulator